MSLDFLKTPLDEANYLANLLTSHATDGKADNSEYAILRRSLLSMPDAESLVPSFVRTNRDLTSFRQYIQPKFKSYQERRTFISKEFTGLLDFLEFGKRPTSPVAEPKSKSTSTQFDLRDLLPPPSITDAPTVVVARNKRKVFIVHGRDDAAKQEVARFITELGLVPIILHEQASAGMTIIEKIERYTNDADFALVLYTACDQGRGVHEKNVSPQFRARQNVVFEHGYLMAKLGRENVCALVKDTIETPNDISGVVYVPLDVFGGWKHSVVTELKACGYKLNSSGPNSTGFA